MVLQNSYFTVVERHDAGDTICFRVRMEGGHEVYKGHFPGNPVSPGVCNLQMVKECAQMVAGRELRFAKISQYRLTGVISPAKYPELDVMVALSEGEGEYALRASVMSGDVSLIQIKATLAGR